jgi:hypothetical protein
MNANLVTQFIQLAYSKYICSDSEIRQYEEQLRALHEYKPRLMRMSATHMNRPWYFAERQNADYDTNIWDGLNEYYKAYNSLGYCIEYMIAYEYLMFMIFKYSNPPEDLKTLAIRPHDMVETIDRIMLDIDKFPHSSIELANALIVYYQVDVDRWTDIWRQRGFMYPRLHE